MEPQHYCRKNRAAEFFNATDVDGVYDLDPNKQKSQKFKKMELKDLRKILVHEDSVAGG